MGTFLSCWFACPAPLKGARFMLCAVWAGSPLAYGRVPYPPYARCGMGRLCGERKRRKRCERLKGARNAACGRQRRIPQELCSPRPVRSPAARARSCRGRRVPAPTARAARPHQPRNPHRASVSSARRAQETRLAAPRSGLRRALRPHQPSEVWRAAALQNVFVSPGFAGRAGSLRPWAQTFLTPAAACAGRKRVPCGHLGRRPKATWRREQIQGLRAASAQNADICEEPTAQPLAK